jgi:hypothetical protein
VACCFEHVLTKITGGGLQRLDSRDSPKIINEFCSRSPTRGPEYCLLSEVENTFARTHNKFYYSVRLTSPPPQRFCRSLKYATV